MFQNKELTFLSICLSFLASGVFAAPPQGGFNGPSSGLTVQDVQGALRASDDTNVDLTGYIISSIGDEDYVFRDQTGEIVVEIDDELWRGLTIKPDIKVNIRGEVDKWMTIEIDVKSLRLAY
ncbi:NirD/YgiW/YdeI family stress tolerance protein [Shewanella mangrovisoli]|uniref:NirD/YgiW/YdeI family stress tolerance protein n=1 Tax=Shewanella mangrovisoli TaxID=2864211 RepID=UPI0035BAC4A4